MEPRLVPLSRTVGPCPAGESGSEGVGRVVRGDEVSSWARGKASFLEVVWSVMLVRRGEEASCIYWSVGFRREGDRDGTKRRI